MSGPSADFTIIRYAQVWEDADVLVRALEPGPADDCLSIASAGDNALALLAGGPRRVLAFDLNPAQIACLELRVAAYRELEHPELLQLIGSRPSAGRSVLYQRCRSLLTPEARRFWDAHPDEIAKGIGSAGKFERYFATFRRLILPLVHGRSKVTALLQSRGAKERADFYARHWDSWRWRFMFRVFFSRRVMGVLGRDPSFFAYVEGSVGDRILARTRYALETLDPAANPYLHWILLGTHGDALPFALREENFERIRSHLDRLEWRLGSLTDVLAAEGTDAFSRCNLSDIFEYVSPEVSREWLLALVGSCRSGARLAYWNMLAPRRRPEDLAERLLPLTQRAAAEFAQDRAFFYSAFVLEEVRK